MPTLKRSRFSRRKDLQRSPTPRRPQTRERRPRTLAAPTPGEVKAVKSLFDQIPRDELEAALQSSDDERAHKLYAILHDAGYDAQNMSMAMRIRAANLTVGETLKAITSLHRTDADLRVARRLPSIMERMAVEAEPHYVPCPRCSDGSDEDVADAVADTLRGAEKRCTRCRGRKVVLRPADNDVRKMVLEGAGVLGQKVPLIDARSIHVHGGVPDMTDFSRSSDESIERLPRRLTAASTAVPGVPEAEIVTPERR